MSTRLQIRARRENYAIYILRGIKAKLHFFIKVVPQPTIDRLRNACDDAIAEIKLEQSERTNRQ